MQALQQRSAMASRVQAQCLAPVRPAVAQRLCFRSNVTAPHMRSRAVQARVAENLEEPLVIGMTEEQQAEMLKLPKGYHWYETMMILKPSLSDEDRDRELAKFEAFLNKEDCLSINALVRPRSRMAYPVQGNWEGLYVLYTYAAKRQTARTIQLMLSKPDVGSEDNVLRHITFCKH